MTVPRGAWTGADDGDGARRTQQACNHRLFTCDVSHARCPRTPTDINSLGCYWQDAIGSLSRSFLVLAPRRLSKALSNCCGQGSLMHGHDRLMRSIVMFVRASGSAATTRRADRSGKDWALRGGSLPSAEAPAYTAVITVAMNNRMCTAEDERVRSRASTPPETRARGRKGATRSRRALIRLK
jgi:hypothetical protein